MGDSLPESNVGNGQSVVKMVAFYIFVLDIIHECVQNWGLPQNGNRRKSWTWGLKPCNGKEYRRKSQTQVAVLHQQRLDSITIKALTVQTMYVYIYMYNIIYYIIDIQWCDKPRQMVGWCVDAFDFFHQLRVFKTTQLTSAGGADRKPRGF